MRGIARQVDDPTGLGRVVDDLLAARAEPPVVLGLGEPTHGIAAFPLLRNELLGHLAGRGFRSVALESDHFAASVVNDHVTGGPGEIDEVLATGFSHGFGAVPGNRELVEWLREHNAARPPADQVRFHGFDAPLETFSVPSPRRALSAVRDHLPAALRPASAGDLDALLGEDADWTNQEAVLDPAKSIGDSANAHALAVVADDLASAVRRASPDLGPADPAGHRLALAHARTALGLLRYHRVLARPAPDRIATLLSVRAEMMAENLLDIVERERGRGPTLVFAHNVHLQRSPSAMAVGAENATWAGAGALAALTLGERYVFVASDANPRAEAGTLQGALAGATDRRALFAVPDLLAALAPSTTAGEPILPGHLPLKPGELAGADAVIFVADTDGTRHQYW